MNSQSPVYTIDNKCQDCYKCVRHCPVKAIRIANGAASVMAEQCVACGECVRVCSSHAKKIRSDLARLRELLSSGARLYASVAPSFSGYFRNVSISQIAAALKSLGFEGVSETAHGAESVSAHVMKIFDADESIPLMISSACPACCDFIRKYMPQWAKYISPLPSPVRAHVRLLREKYGDDIKVVFFGPCAAKKNEADRAPEELALAVTFPSLEALFDENGILPEDMETGGKSEEELLALGSAKEGRFYPVEGGMNDTLRDNSSRLRFLAVSGIDNLRRLLSAKPPEKKNGAHSIFIEALACAGGCVNGPAMREGAGLDTLLAIDRHSPIQTSHGRNFTHCGTSAYPPVEIMEANYPETEISQALARVGKTCKEDELNCGACGYDSCRSFAKALLAGKAEESMCHTFLKQNFQRTSNALIRYIPAAVVIVDCNLAILESNRHFAEISDVVTAFDTLGSLEGMSIQSVLPEFESLFAGAIRHNSEIEKFRQPLKSRLVNISVFPIVRGESAGAIIQDVTGNEYRLEQVAAKAREVIQKNVQTVQEVARLFGEHIAETEIMLNEIAGTYESHTPGVSLNGGDSDDYLNG